MEKDRREKVIEVVDTMMGKFEAKLDVAMHVREELEKLYGKSWHCIVGADFTSSIRISGNQNVSMQKGSLQITVYKT